MHISIPLEVVIRRFHFLLFLNKFVMAIKKINALESLSIIFEVGWGFYPGEWWSVNCFKQEETWLHGRIRLDSLLLGNSTIQVSREQPWESVVHLTPATRLRLQAPCQCLEQDSLEYTGNVKRTKQNLNCARKIPCSISSHYLVTAL